MTQLRWTNVVCCERSWITIQFIFESCVTLHWPLVRIQLNAAALSVASSFPWYWLPVWVFISFNSLKCGKHQRWSCNKEVIYEVLFTGNPREAIFKDLVFAVLVDTNTYSCSSTAIHLPICYKPVALCLTVSRATWLQFMWFCNVAHLSFLPLHPYWQKSPNSAGGLELRQDKVKDKFTSSEQTGQDLNKAPAIQTLAAKSWMATMYFVSPSVLIG